MIGEVIAIGDELTTGQRLDTNSQWVAERLCEIGVNVLYHTTVADDLAANVRVFREAASRADVIVATGGLGPTADDLTRDALAAAAGVTLMQDDAALAHIQQLFANRKRPMPPKNAVQAMFPVGSRVIPNPFGTAPGIDIDLPRSGGGAARAFALPGVPAEMKEMWQKTVAPTIEVMNSPDERRVIRHRRIRCFGVGESDLEQMLPDLIRRGRVPRVGITVSQATITLRITAEGATPEACFAAMEPTVATIHECIGSLVYGEEEDELHDAVARLLAQKGKTLAVVEWGTAGLITNSMETTPQAKDVFRGGLVVTDSSVLERVLNVPYELFKRNPHVGGEAIEAMAENCRRVFGADYALAVGDFPATSGDKPGDFFIALSGSGKTIVKSARTAGHPDILLSRSAKQALDMLRLTLVGKTLTK